MNVSLRANEFDSMQKRERGHDGQFLLAPLAEIEHPAEEMVAVIKRLVGRNPSLAIQFVEECALMGKADYAEKFVALVREKEPDIRLCDEVSILNYSNFAKSRTADENVKLLIDMERLGLIFYQNKKFAFDLATYV